MPSSIGAHDVGLANSLRTALGLDPSDTAIVSLDHELTGGVDRLGAAGIRCAARAGLVRLSFHLYNTDDDVSAVLDVVQHR